jgi:hypothetical protein
MTGILLKPRNDMTGILLKPRMRMPICYRDEEVEMCFYLL